MELQCLGQLGKCHLIREQTGKGDRGKKAEFLSFVFLSFFLISFSKYELHRISPSVTGMCECECVRMSLCVCCVVCVCVCVCLCVCARVGVCACLHEYM